MSETARLKYRALVADLAALEQRVDLMAAHGGRLYLTDENVDRENVGLDESDPHFWGAMVATASSSAGMRAEGYRFNVNDALGRVIY